MLGLPARLGAEIGIFSADQRAEFDACYREYGFATLRGVVAGAALEALVTECVAAQAGVVNGQLPDRYGTARFLEEDGAAKAETFANYVQFITEVSPATRSAVVSKPITDARTRLLGDDCWLLEHRPAVPDAARLRVRPGGNRDEGIEEFVKNAAR